MLAKAGYDVDSAGDGRQAIEKFQKDPDIRLILMDTQARPHPHLLFRFVSSPHLITILATFFTVRGFSGLCFLRFLFVTVPS